MELLIKQLEAINQTLKLGLQDSKLDILIPIITTVFSVFVGAFLGYFFSNKSEKNRLRIENHRKFLEDFNNYYIQIHELYQEIYSYDQLVCHLGFPQYLYDFNLKHIANMQNVLNAEQEYQNFIKNNVKGSVPLKEQYWEKIHNTCIKLQDFNLIISLAGSMNQNAHISSMFVSKNIKKAFDRIIIKTQKMSQNNFADFNLQEYRLDLISILQLIKNELDPKKEPIYFENQDYILNKKDAVKINVFSNCFYVEKNENNTVKCKNAKGKKYKFDKDEIQPF